MPTRVAITKSKLDTLANTISAKSGEPILLTIDEMTAAVKGISTVEDSLPVFTITFPDEGDAIVTCNKTYAELYSMVKPQQQFNSAAIGVFPDDNDTMGFAGWITPNNTIQFLSYEPFTGFPNGEIDVASDGTMTYFYWPDRFYSTLNVTENGTYDSENQGILWSYVNVNIPTGTARTSSDVTVSGATVTIPAGLYSTQISKSVASGTAGTPTATKGTVSNNSITVTPSVTNTTGYITGGTKTGTAVTVSASELVSGTFAVDSSGTKNVTNYASISVPAGSVTAPSTISGSSATVSTGTNTLTLTKTISVTPSVTTAGYVSEGTAGDSSVSLTASVTTQGATTYNTSSSDQTIAAGTYLTGTQTIRKVTTSGIDAANIKDGTIVQVGDADSTGRIANVTGTFTDASTVSSGQTAATSSKILRDYSAWVDGAEVKGNISNMTLPTAPTSSGFGSAIADIPVSDSYRYINIRAGYNPSDQHYRLLPVVTGNITENFIKSGIRVGVGNGGDIYGIVDVTGTFTSASTVSSGQTAATAAHLLSGYSAWVNGDEIKGNIATITMPTSASSSATSGYTSNATISRSTSDQYINIPKGYNASNVYYKINAVPNGTAGTPTATKGSVSNNSITVTPSVTNTTGYITGGTVSGSAVTVSASELVSGTKSITSNGTNIDVTNYAAVDVSVSGAPPVIESLEITPSETAQTYNSSSVDGYKPVTIAAVSSTYVGSGITRRSSTDLTASGATVTVPAGYYSSQATKSVTTATLPTSTTTTKPSGTTKLTIDRSTSTRYLSIPAGYQDGGFYTISAVANGTVTAPSSISGTTATISTGTNTLTLTKTVSVTPSVTTAGYVSAGTAGNSSVSLTASVITKAAATITPGTTNQTIAAGTYLTGTQTISGDADLVGSNILSTANIFGVQGTVVVQHIYSGSSAPSSSTGANGDVYIRTS